MTLLNLLMLQAMGADNGSMMWIMIIAMFAILYFFMIRPQNKKQKEINNFRKQLQINQSVVTAGGIHGNVRIRIDKNSIFADASDANATQAVK